MNVHDISVGEDLFVMQKEKMLQIVTVLTSNKSPVFHRSMLRKF